ncbi:DUF1697 domain-containing protein [Nocardia sp. alder85J]|uniref:DUF1697 domain-containing protein n=1 Tax=Nocardia sp. alder85J TaxID=2862949 RepID=UPI001CD49B45|nr:DUF1697 domain-containing protein [Nocardia sp. alder85J]MCX4095284.1 DUF1697 domain-containing protein [Nocardia sp. alder85J]
MIRYAALLRGIMPTNPNMRGEKLRGVLSGLGFDAVGSVLTSGNLVFGCTETDVPALESQIQQALRAELGIAGGTLVRSRAELQALVDAAPFGDRTHGRGSYLTVTFVKDGDPGPPSRPLPKELTSVVNVLGYDPGARAVLAVIDNTAGSTPNHMAWLETMYGKDITTRTWLTVQKVLAKL